MRHQHHEVLQGGRRAVPALEGRKGQGPGRRHGGAGAGACTARAALLRSSKLRCAFVRAAAAAAAALIPAGAKLQGPLLACRLRRLGGAKHQPGRQAKPHSIPFGSGALAVAPEDVCFSFGKGKWPRRRTRGPQRLPQRKLQRVLQRQGRQAEDLSKRDLQHGAAGGGLGTRACRPVRAVGRQAEGRERRGCAQQGRPQLGIQLLAQALQEGSVIKVVGGWAQLAPQEGPSSHDYSEGPASHDYSDRPLHTHTHTHCTATAQPPFPACKRCACLDVFQHGGGPAVTTAPLVVSRTWTSDSSSETRTHRCRRSASGPCAEGASLPPAAGPARPAAPASCRGGAGGGGG